MKTPALLLLFALASVAPTAAQTPVAAPTPASVAQATTRLSGTVLDGAGHPLPGANVFLKTTFDGATTDSLGRFAFSTTATGTLPLVCTLIGYALQETPLALTGGVLALPPCRLRESRASLGTVTIVAGAFEASDEKRSATLKPLDILTTAGAMANISTALNTLPGTTRVGEEGKLFVRGGAASETRYYLDGLPVQSFYGGSTAGMPARGRFSPSLFKGTLFSTGGYSAEYGQALSAVVGLNSLDLDPETQTGISLLSVGGSLSRTKRWARTSASVNVDYTNLAPYFGLTAPAQRWEQAPQTLGGAFRLVHRTGQTGMLKLYATYSHQQVASRQADPEAAYALGGRLTSLQNTNYYFNTTYRTAWRRGWSLNAGLALGRERNAVQPEPQRIGTLEQTATARLVLTNDSASTWYNLKLGTENTVQRYDLTYQATPDAPVATPGFLEKRTAVFAESDLSLAPRLTGRVGLRGEYSALLHKANLAPRAALAWQLGAGEQLSAAAGLFYQNPTNDLLYVQPALGFERAAHYILTYQHMAAGRILRVDTYRKDYRGLVCFDRYNTLNASAYANSGSGYAQGVDVLWRDQYRTFKKIDYWVSYGLLDTRRQFRADLAPAVPTFAATHTVSLVGKYWVQQLHLQVSATYAYGSPRAYYDPNQPGYNQGRTPSSQQFDLGLSYLTHLAGQYTIVHLSMSNVLGRDNLYGYRYATTPDAATGRYAAVPVRSLMPQLVVAALFISVNKKTPGDTSVAPE
ncbi:TonB-dependent receptor plug domain-containing protein [Hymenobacter sp. HMF4947]|uniref:TonB-dependent receptor plug domain-containing protein n=1 Tax=Hymenobacter ginkgonis TaxID=2682976 RepID=A0A7K1TFD6_9BACT|nr:TonB-dependent receptor [Hymenobacter ginkgonis]MVN77124.1 TonB-dependent receptor plug domain-containing protein [Hymenobacter ginkgonis]